VRPGGGTKGASPLGGALLVYRKEVRSLLRDRHTVIYSVLLPLFLYPGLTWGVIEGSLYMTALEERSVSEILAVGAAGDAGFLGFLRSKEKLSMTETVPARASDPGALLAAGEAQALVQCSRGPGYEAPELEVAVFFDASKDASLQARDRIVRAAGEWRKKALETAAEDVAHGEGGSAGSALLDALPVTEVDIATGGEIANYTISLILPLMMIVMTALSALYPALEATVGEKERGSLETTLLSPIPRSSVVTGKYFAVVSFALLGFLLNFTSMAFTFLHLNAQLRIQGLSFGAGTIALVVAGAALLALFLSTIMMLLGFLARSFKEGQTYLTPIYLIAVLPALVTASPDAALTPELALVPVVNLALLFREALKGDVPAEGAMIALASSLAYSGFLLLGAAMLLRREEYATGGRLDAGKAALRFRFGRRRHGRAPPDVDDAAPGGAP